MKVIPMKKFNVYITRTYVHGATIQVEADSPKDAEQKAIEEIGDHSMSIKEGLPDHDTADCEGEIDG